MRFSLTKVSRASFLTLVIPPLILLALWFPATMVGNILAITPGSVQGELILADGGYRDKRYFETPTGYNNRDQRMKKVARSRHETFNARIKNFKILASKYRVNLHFHHYVFHSIVNMLQIDIENGNKLFQLNYYDVK